MKINIGTSGRVIGTKKVNASGQVAGLKAHAGQEILLVSPSQTPRYGFTLADRAHQARQAAITGFRQARRLTGRLSLPRVDAKQVVVLRNHALSAARQGTTRLATTAKTLTQALPRARRNGQSN